MRKIDKFYEKFNGSYFALLGAAISLGSIFIAIILYIAVDPTFTIITHYISDLGDGQNYSNIVFNVSHIITGILYIFFFYYLSLYLQKKEVIKRRTRMAFIGGLTYSVGLILAGIFPSKASYEMHIIAAAILFFGMFFICMFYGISEYNTPEFSKTHSITGFIVAPFPIIFMLFQVLSYLFGFDLRITIFTEWITYIAMTSWIINQGIYTLR